MQALTLKPRTTDPANSNAEPRRISSRWDADHTPGKLSVQRSVSAEDGITKIFPSLAPSSITRQTFDLEPGNYRFVQEGDDRILQVTSGGENPLYTIRYQLSWLQPDILDGLESGQAPGEKNVCRIMKARHQLDRDVLLNQSGPSGEFTISEQERESAIQHMQRKIDEQASGLVDGFSAVRTGDSLKRLDDPSSLAGRRGSQHGVKHARDTVWSNSTSKAPVHKDRIVTGLAAVELYKQLGIFPEGKSISNTSRRS
jgi:hypothetical protein